MASDDTLGQTLHELRHPAPSTSPVQAPQTSVAVSPARPALDRWQRSFLGRRAAVITVERRLEASVAQVTAALGRVAPATPWLFELKSFTGSLSAGGVAGFRLPQTAAVVVNNPLSALGVRALEVAVETAGDGARLTLRLPLDDLARRVTRESAAVSAVGSALAGVAGAAAAHGVVVGALLAIPFALGFGLALPIAAAISALSWQKREADLARHTGELADAIVLDVRLGGAFAGVARAPVVDSGAELLQLLS